MAEIASPALDPRSLRRHYPHQVQGVVQLDLSAIAAPPHRFSLRIRPGDAKSTTREIAGHAYGRPTNVESIRAVKTFEDAVSHQVAIGLLRALCSCGKWPSISHSPVSTRFRHCRYRTYPCRRRCLPPSPCRSRRRHLSHRRTCHSR